MFWEGGNEGVLVDFNFYNWIICLWYDHKFNLNGVAIIEDSRKKTSKGGNWKWVEIDGELTSYLDTWVLPIFVSDCFIISFSYSFYINLNYLFLWFFSLLTIR